MSARTSRGDVIARQVRVPVELDTAGGDGRAERIDGRIAAHTSGGDISAELLGANRGISASTSGGDIELRVPASAGALVDFSVSGGSIHSELPVTSTEVRERKLRGTLGSGGETLHARTSGGSIKLLKAQP